MAAIAPFPEDVNAQKAYIHKARQDVIQKLAAQSRRSGTVPDANTEPAKSLYARLEALLTDLDEKVKMTPDIKNETKIHDGLRVMFGSQGFHFPAEMVEKARALYEKWEAEHWGGAPPPPPPVPGGDMEDSIEDDDEDVAPAPKRQKSMSGDRFSIKCPPKDHPIWGINGIMHGLALKTNLDRNTKSTVWNTEYSKKNPKVFGHNGITPGTWYPSQLSTLFHGAHGSSQGGITGDPALGAYSIVVSGMYETMDYDRGDIVYYSGSGSHDNTDPSRAAQSTSGTRALGTSITTGKPVRLLRASRGHSRFAPTEGIRYDGLYRVVEKRYPKNEKGGLYEQFRLERVDDGQQPSLESCKKRPTGQDLRDFERIRNGYSGRR